MNEYKSSRSTKNSKQAENSIAYWCYLFSWWNTGRQHGQWHKIPKEGEKETKGRKKKMLEFVTPRRDSDDLSCFLE